MNNETSAKETRISTGWITALALTVAVCLCALLFMRIHYGDSEAPMDVVPDKWRAFLAITDRNPTVKLEMTFHVLRTRPGKPAMVPLFSEGTVFKNVRLNSTPMSPVKRDGWHCAAIPRSGRFVVTAEVEVKPEHDGAITRLSMRKPDFIQSLIEVDSGEAWEVRVAGVQGRISGSIPHGTIGVLQLGRDSEFTAEWRKPRPDVERIGSPSVVPAVAWAIGERTLSANALLNIDIVGGLREQITILVPKGSGRVKLTGADVRDTRLTDNRLAVYFREPVTGMTELRLSFEVPRPAGDIAACPALEVEEGRVDAGGWIMVINDSRGILLENSATGMQETSDLDIPAPLLGLARGKPLYFYQVTARGAEPVFDIVDRTPFPIVDTIADRAEIFVVIQPGGEEITRIIYTVRNNSRQFLRMSLPAGTELLSVELDNSARKVSTDGANRLLIPLPKSIQTVGGLIPFPLEIVYCRQGAPVRRGTSRVLDLPELPDVPVAAVKAVVFSPSPGEYRSALVHGTRWATQEDIDFGMGRRTRSISHAWLNRELARQYYALGTESYQENRLEDAYRFLNETAKFKEAGAPILAQSKDILGNIRAGRGEINTSADRGERARIQAIQTGLARDNEQLQLQQDQLIADGLANLDSGSEEFGAELLKQADEIGAQLEQRSASRSRQKAVRRDYGQRLSQVEDERKKNDDLQKKYTRLQEQVQKIAQESGGTPAAAAKGKLLARGILSATSKRQMDVGSVQSPDAYAEANQQASDISAGAEARQIRNQPAGKGGSSLAASKQPSTTVSLRDRNIELDAKVSALEEAFNWAEKDPGQAQAPVDASEVSRANSLIETAETKLATIRAELTQHDSITLNDIAAEQELTNLADWVHVSRNTFGAIDERMATQFFALQSGITETRVELEQARRRRQGAEFVEVPLAGNGLDNRNGREAFSRFLEFNYTPSEDNGRQMYAVKTDKLRIWNGEGLPEKLNEIMDKFTVNGGRVVSVVGRTLALAPRDIPVVNEWFAAKTGGNRRYAMLDEAQYRTIVQAAAFVGLRQDNGMPPAEGRDVIVGTGNTLAGQEFRVVRAEADANTLSIDGTDLSVRHNQYLALDDGDHLTVLNAGGVHDWRDAACMTSVLADPPARIELPETGIPVFLAKTLLSAGESPDIEMMFQ